ncbi:type II toxin-antitoxin system RelB/DinJ family antitoxin [Candidatus Poribacteria bacterium]|nr:type II toxin-antitoxin system RelB/DinJ family antitoxin [Candidatus Poribacteria bacterium]
MSKSAMIRARMEPELKAQVDRIFQELGLTTTEAITLFYKQVKAKNGIPFELTVPDQMTVETAKKTDSRKELNEYSSLEDFRKKMGI